MLISSKVQRRLVPFAPSRFDVLEYRPKIIYLKFVMQLDVGKA